MTVSPGKEGIAHAAHLFGALGAFVYLKLPGIHRAVRRFPAFKFIADIVAGDANILHGIRGDADKGRVVRAGFRGDPACFIETIGEAPVPPAFPEIVIASAEAFATPTAMVPTPGPDTSFTETLANGLKVLRS